MIPKKFDYLVPTSVDDAVRLLAENDGAKVVAGGQSLLALMKLRLAAPDQLVDISRLPGLSYVREEADHLAIGALTTMDFIERDERIKRLFPIITDAIARVGDQQVRNLGTIGGSACHADPSADLPTALLAADARFIVRGSKGSREVAARDFFVDYFATTVGHDEILTEVRLPRLPPRSGSAFFKHSLRVADFAIAIAGAVLTLEGGNTCRDVRIGIGAAGPKPMRAVSAEEHLRGKIIDDSTIAGTANLAIDAANPPSDAHGSREYRLEMIKVVTKRALRLALSRAGWT